MKKLNDLSVKTKLFFKNNSSTILTCIGSIGVVTTAVLAVKATPKAICLLESAEEEKGEELTTLETVKIAGPAYIPAAITGVSTIACIFGANILSKRQQASLMSAYALVENSYKEYKNKIKILYGDDADKEITKEIVKDRYENYDVSVSDEKQLFFDYFSMRYFESTMEEVLIGENNFNKNLTLNGYASLDELYDSLGIPRVDYGYELGWSHEAGGAFYGYSWIDFEHEKITLEGDLECCIISMSHEPTADFLGF